MPVPAIVSDGNFKTAQQNGAVSYSFPFSASRNDFKTFIASRTMRVASASFVRPASMSQRSFGNLGTGYLVEVTDPIAIEGTDLVEYVERYAPVPGQQKVYASAAGTIQQLVNVPPDADPPRIQPVNISDVFDGVYIYDYSLNQPLEPVFKTILKQYPGGIQNSLQVGFDLKLPPTDGLYLVQNSTSERWMGDIYCRLSIYVKPPPIRRWVPPA